MSIDIMNRVWKHSKQGGSQLLLLLAIADNSNDSGGYAWPSQETLAKKIRMSPKSIPRLTGKLMDKGELFINNRSDRGKVTQYIITVEMPWDDFKEILEKGFKFKQADLVKAKAWFTKKVGGPQVVPPPSCTPPATMGTGVDKAMGTKPLLTINEPSISPSAENELSELIQPEDNETIPPVEADPQVSVFDENGYIIPQVETVLETMYKIGVVKMEEYDSHPHLGNIMWYRWVDSGQSVESIPLKLAEEYGYKPETSGPPEVVEITRPENVLVDTRTPYEVDEQTQGEKEETLTDVFGPNPRQQATQPNDKPELSEADTAHLRTFGSLPGNETKAFDTVQEIKQSGWEIWDPTVEQGIAHCLEAIRTKKPNFVIPNNVSVRKDWHKDVNGHLQDYKPDALGTLYRLAVDKLEKAGMSYSRPGSLTKTLPDVVNEPTSKTIIDEDGGFYV